MFTGIIEEVGRIAELEDRAAGVGICVACSTVLEDMGIGASIAVNGTCLTAVQIGVDSWWADVAPETLKRTNLGDLQPGSAVNLERPLRANSRLDGHFVVGHVDGTAEIISLNPLGDDNWWLQIRVPSELTRYIVTKGSLALDGISLTVAEIVDDLASFTVIPYTYKHTALHARLAGSRLNVEVDILAKHLERLTSGIVPKTFQP
jgi:riboflavin synthase